MGTYQEITEARKLLGVPEKTSLHEIKARYRKLLNTWHPDKCEDSKREECHEKTKKIITAYKRLMEYCFQYKISFAKTDMHPYLSPEEQWYERFGNDPLWGWGNSGKS